MSRRPIRRTDTDPGWTNRKFRDLERQLREQAAAKRLQAATITEGGITVLNGGITIKGGDGFVAEYANGGKAVTFGPGVTSDGRKTQGLWVRDELGRTTFAALRTPYDPAYPYPDGQRVVQVGSPSQSVSLFYVFSDDFALQAAGGAEFTMAAGGMNLVGIVKMQVGTTASAANAYIDPSSGQVLRSTSSRRYKQDIEPAAVDVDQVLALQPRRFRRKDQVAEHGDDAPTYVGFIAEEAAELGLDDWVTSDDDGPEAFSYATWAVALQAVVRQQAQQIADLTARLDALESPAEGA